MLEQYFPILLFIFVGIGLGVGPMFTGWLCYTLLGFQRPDGETRTRTAFATAPSRRRVYQFHHVGDKPREM